MKKVIRTNKSLGSDISDYQKWVDFDTKKYGKISDTTMKDIKKAGLSVAKDQYGDYEVIADDKVEGGCHGKKKVTASEDFTEINRVDYFVKKIGRALDICIDDAHEIMNADIISDVSYQTEQLIHTISKAQDQLKHIQFNINLEL